MAVPQFIPPPSLEADAPKTFSLIEDEAPLRWQRALHLAPPDGLGIMRRAVFFALLTWLPIATWALVRGRFLEAPVGEPLLQHYGVHIRCLFAIPLLILGEATLHQSALRFVPQFTRLNLVDDATRPRFEAVLRAAQRWRNDSLPWLLVIGAAFAWTLIDRANYNTEEMSWAVDAENALGFGGVWFVYVARPILSLFSLAGCGGSGC